MNVRRIPVILAVLLLAAAAAPAGPERPGVLVVGFRIAGGLLQREGDVDFGMEVVVEAVLAGRFEPVSGERLEQACADLEFRSESLLESPDRRLAAAKAVGAARCITGWACSFGDRIVLVLEVIDPSAGLPGKVVRASCDGLERIPETLEALLVEAGLLGDEPVPPAEPAVTERRSDLRRIWERIPEDDLLETYPDEAYEELIEQRESAETPWCDEATYREAERLLETVWAHLRRLREDRRYRDEYVIRLNVRKHPVYRERAYEVISRPPYLVFVEKGGPDPVAGVEYADRLGRFYEEFHRLYGDRFRLPRLSERERAHERVLKVFVMTGDSRSAELQEHIGQPLPPGVGCYYRPADQWLTMFEGGAGRRHHITDAFGRAKLIHEATHQLTHVYAKILMERDVGEEVVWTDARLRSRSHWLQEGFAELMSSAEAGREEGTDFSAVYSGRVNEWQATRRRELTEWSLREILEIRTGAELRAQAARKGLAHALRLSSLFYAQSWTLCHLLWNHDEGRYRGRFLRLLEQDLHGRSGIEVFKQTLFGDDFDERDLVLLEQEWLSHFESLSK